jgi:hypothetical protein
MQVFINTSIDSNELQKELDLPSQVFYAELGQHSYGNIGAGGRIAQHAALMEVLVKGLVYCLL